MKKEIQKMNEKFLSNLFDYLKKKWYIILSFVLGSMLLFSILQLAGGVNKNISSVTWEYGAIVDYPKHSTFVDEKNIKRYYNYTEIWYRSPILQQFVFFIDDKYDMEEIEKEWQNKNDAERIAWVRQHFLSESIANTGAYEFIFRITKEEAKKDDLKQGESLLIDFIDFVSESLLFMADDISYSIEWKSDQVTESPALPQEQVLLKYIIVGGIFGVLVSVFGLTFIFTSRKK